MNQPLFLYNHSTTKLWALLPEEMTIIPERRSQTYLLAFMHKQMWQKLPYTQEWYGLISLEITLTKIKEETTIMLSTPREAHFFIMIPKCKLSILF